MGEKLRVAKKCNIKRKITFFSVNTKYISSRELKTSEFSLVLRTRENSVVFNTLDEIYLVFTSKKVNVLYVVYMFVLLILVLLLVDSDSAFF